MLQLPLTTLARGRLVLLASLMGLWACGNVEGRDPAATTMPGPTSSGTTSEQAGTTADAVEDGTTLATTTVEPEPTTTALDDTGASTGEPFGEPFSMSDPLVDGTMGTAVGGSFGPEGWTITDRTDRLYWSLPRLVEGSIEFTVTGLTIDLMPLNDHEIFAMYEGGWGIEHPIAYNPEFRVNDYKSMIRIYGQAEVDRVGQVKLMWGLCPQGAPGYGIDTCACASFFEEPFGGDPAWDGTPQRLRVEWDALGSRLLRNGALVLDIDASASGLFFGPQALYASLGTPRPLDVDTAGMPVGATFSDVVIEGITGPEATCG
ncbi:MAG: hypothetical protein KDK70_16050 [Myxococcales bacterium]|nr:hypothetical protein [Myxococcales bacterium]